MVIDGAFEPAPADGLVLRAATGLDANTIATEPAGVRRRLLREFVCRGLLPRDDAQAYEYMTTPRGQASHNP